MSAVTEAKTLEQVVEIINTDGAVEYFGGTDLHSPEQRAAQYALSAAEESGYGVDDSNIEGHLEILVEHGAKFDFQGALKEAKASRGLVEEEDGLGPR